MEILLIRHGQTEGNVAKRHQEETTKLTPLGVRQAHEVAKEVKAFKPTHLLSSSLVRTIQTSTIIGDVCGLVPETSHDFIELVRPCYIYGHYHRSLKSINFYIHWYFRDMGGDGGREGESYEALIERIKRAQAHLATYPNDARIAVVSHAVFITFFLAHLCNEKKVNILRGFKVFKDMLTIKNGEIIPLTYDPLCDSDNCAWTVNR